MNIQITPELDARLAELARRTGRDVHTVAQEALAQYVDYESWFVQQVEIGLAQIERGALVSHEDVGTRMEHRLREKAPRV